MRNLTRNPLYVIAIVTLMLMATMLTPASAYAAPVADGTVSCPDGSSFSGPIADGLAFLNARCPAGAMPAAPAAASGATSFDTGTMPAATGHSTQGAWNVTEFERLAESPIVAAWIARLPNAAPNLWQTFPNIPNSLVPAFKVVNGKQVPWGAEYGMADAPFCEQDQRCDFVVPAWSYRLITGDYTFKGMSCAGNCLLLLVNVMNKTYTWRNQSVDNGFTVHGRYWDGDNLEWAVWGLVSHASANMLNMPTLAREGEVLNAGTGSSSNAGSNCGDAMGCLENVNARVVIHAGDAFVAMLEATVTRDGTIVATSPVTSTRAAAEATPAVEPLDDGAGEVAVDIISIPGNTVINIPAGYAVAGDIWFGPCDGSNWNKMLDSNSRTAMVVDFQKPGCAFINGTWEAEASNRPAAELIAEKSASYDSVQKGVWK